MKNKKYETVSDCLDEATEPLRAKDILEMVEKSKFSIFRELRWLSKVNEIDKVIISEDHDRLIIRGYVKKKRGKQNGIL